MIIEMPKMILKTHIQRISDYAQVLKPAQPRWHCLQVDQKSSKKLKQFVTKRR